MAGLERGRLLVKGPERDTLDEVWSRPAPVLPSIPDALEDPVPGPRRRMPRTHRFAPLALLALIAACSRGPALGSDDAVIVALDPGLADSLEPVVRRALEREVFTTRPEGVFEVTFTSPAGIGEFRNWARLVVIEPLDGAALVPELVDDASGDVFVRLEDAWARGQTIWVLAAPTPAATERLATARLDSVYRSLHANWATHQVERMWASHADSAGAERMRAELGFSLVLPNVYKPASSSAPPDTRTWYNEDPRRIVSLHWQPAPTALSAEAVLEARRVWGRDLFTGDEIQGALPIADSSDASGEPADTTGVPAPPLQASRTTLAGMPAVRLQGVWQNASDLTAGLFLTYGVVCDGRLVLLDGNLYAPDRNKYPYLLQLERILETFRCGP
jgi:hypothetical protein